MTTLIRTACLVLAAALLPAVTAQATSARATPNVVVIFIDDMGYADIGPFGCESYPTPHLDRMAAEGRVFTDFHAATAVCSASRAALMTGCYPSRVSIQGALSPGARHGLHPHETTIAEVCKSRGYATACFGKWHLGHLPEFLPTRQGFDEYFGLPYSNDMWPYPPGREDLEHGRRGNYPPLPLYKGERIVNVNLTPADQALLTTQYTERAVDFIDRHAGKQPFFLYVPHTMVHVPLYVSEKFAGKSGAGLYGDVVMELDWSVGEILAALERGGVGDDTLVVFTSDNGPWINFGEHAGSAGPLREGKGTMWEGGYREPCVMRWPARIPAGTRCDEFATTMDLLPTIAGMIGAELPERKIDGKDILPVMTGDAPSPHEVFYCYYDRQLRAVRDARWKLVLPHQYRTLAGRSGGKDGFPVEYEQSRAGLELYDLKNDVGETTNVAAEHPEIVARLQGHAEQARRELGDELTKRKGSNVRPSGRAARS
ncbi:sulfatase [Botrimarina mediterranea]|uniref:Arylsulfatase n=1 Tax=Botrimarina mediterranea TaxID=2528022 RepID=A0A518K4V8_9BACT|nr:sulfatase [Botrimarina mediterranea]QDV72830.1 Arylsulfatase [Botrimarina mediterranea]QDV77404.1 Arylsulfatase [Planctomycetes bacterium K2D]